MDNHEGCQRHFGDPRSVSSVNCTSKRGSICRSVHAVQERMWRMYSEQDRISARKHEHGSSRAAVRIILMTKVNVREEGKKTLASACLLVAHRMCVLQHAIAASSCRCWHMKETAPFQWSSCYALSGGRNRQPRERWHD